MLEIQQGNISEKLSDGEVRLLRKYREVELLCKFADEALREIKPGNTSEKLSEKLSELRLQKRKWDSSSRMLVLKLIMQKKMRKIFKLLRNRYYIT